MVVPTPWTCGYACALAMASSCGLERSMGFPHNIFSYLVWIKDIYRWEKWRFPLKCLVKHRNPSLFWNKLIRGGAIFHLFLGKMQVRALKVEVPHGLATGKKFPHFPSLIFQKKSKDWNTNECKNPFKYQYITSLTDGQTNIQLL